MPDESRRSTAHLPTTAPAPERTMSRTAVGVAVLRAAHQLLDAPPRILDDPIVLDLLPPAAVQNLREHPEHFQTAAVRALRAHVVTRSRFAEDRLADAVARGVRQYVMLGAGLDTFACRQPAWAGALRIVEVDHAASQLAKRERLAAAGIVVPANVTFAAIDFESEPLATGLARCGVDLAVPTFFSWLGVMTYLTAEAADAVFRTVASFPALSEIAFTFASPRAPDDPMSPFAARAAAVGEPWRTFVTPEVLTATLEQLGFTNITLLPPDAAAARYFRGRSDALPPPTRTSIAAAVR